MKRGSCPTPFSCEATPSGLAPRQADRRCGARPVRRAAQGGRDLDACVFHKHLRTSHALSPNLAPRMSCSMRRCRDWRRLHKFMWKVRKSSSRRPWVALVLLYLFVDGRPVTRELVKRGGLLTNPLSDGAFDAPPAPPLESETSSLSDLLAHVIHIHIYTHTHFCSSPSAHRAAEKGHYANNGRNPRTHVCWRRSSPNHAKTSGFGDSSESSRACTIILQRRDARKQVWPVSTTARMTRTMQPAIGDVPKQDAARHQQPKS